MAATKKPKSAKSMDVTSASMASPSHTAKPVIVSNRPMIKDPMVNSGDTPATDLDNPTTSPVLPTRTAKTITPTGSDTEKAKPAPDPKAESDTAPELEPRQVPQLVKNMQREKAAEQAANKTEDKTEDKIEDKTKDTAETSTEAEMEYKKPAPQNTEGKDVEKPPALLEPDSGTPVAENEESSLDDEHADTEVERTESSAESTEMTPGAVSSVDELDASDEDTPDQPDELAKADAAEAKETARVERIQELIDEKTYFLPIKTATKKSTKLGVLVLLIAAAAAAGYYYMFTQR